MPDKMLMPHMRCVVAGAGPAGLSAIYHLDNETLLLEKNSTIGGGCRSIEEKGFTFDYAGHIMFTQDAYVRKLYEVLLGDNLHWQNREAWIYSKEVYTRYPFQGALYGLPSEIIKECIIGAIEAKFGKIDGQVAKNSDKLANKINDCCADGVVEPPEHTAISAPSLRCCPAPQNFEQFIYKTWGEGIAKHFLMPYNKKLWTIPLTAMDTSWLNGRVPICDLTEIIESALKPVSKPMGPNAVFGYPLRGGFQALVTGFLPHIKGKVELNAEIVHLSPRNRRVTLADGRVFEYDVLISTIPLPELVKCMQDEAPETVIRAAQDLKRISIRCVNLGVARENITDKHWIYFPEDTIFHRIFVQGNASPHCNPPGGFGLTCEISYSPWKPLPYDGEALLNRCIQDCINVGLLTREDTLITANEVDIPYAYIVHDHARQKNVSTIKNWLEEHDIILSGRYSEWEYYNSDHAFLAGKRAAEAAAFKLGIGS